MDAVDREELIRLLTEALMRDSAFRLRRRNWAADEGRHRIEARTCAANLRRASLPLRNPLVASPARAAA